VKRPRPLAQHFTIGDDYDPRRQAGARERDAQIRSYAGRLAGCDCNEGRDR